MQKRVKNLYHNEKGISLLLAALFVSILAGLAALVIGIGILSSAHSRVQNMANLVSVGVLEEVLSGTTVNKAIARANQLLGQNRLFGAPGAMGDIAGTGGFLEFGTWHIVQPEGSDPCSGNYPCFEVIADPLLINSANAVRATVQNQTATNPIIAPFAQFLGYGEQYAAKSAISTVAGQCTILLQDSSSSIALDTHKINNPIPANNAVFAYPLTNCVSPSTPAEQQFCNQLGPNRSGSTSSITQFQDDYDPTLHTYAGKNYRIHSLYDPVFMQGPEPMRTLFLATNAGLRSLHEQAVGSRWMGIGFRETITNSANIPAVPNLLQFAYNPGILIQITNMNNRGTFDTSGIEVTPRLSPNMIDAGWFPQVDPNDPFREHTNMIQAIQAAIIAFELPSGPFTCPREYQKSIILATDGIGNCYKSGGGPFDYTCNDSYNGYLQHEAQLKLIRDELKAKNIEVVALVAGEHVQPHFIERNKLANPNIPDDYDTNSNDDFLTIDELLNLGFGGLDAPAGFELVEKNPDVSADATNYSTFCTANCPSCNSGGNCSNLNACFGCQNRYAYENLGEVDALGNPKVVFRRPLASLVDLVVATDGTYCPLQPTYPALSYLDDGDPNTADYLDTVTYPTLRQNLMIQDKSVVNLTTSEQAQKCVEKNYKRRLILVEEE